MTIIIETGAPVDGANSYITEAELTTYLTDRGYAVPDTPKPLMIRAFDYMSSLNWNDSHTEPYTVTTGHKNANCEIVYRFSLGSDPSAAPSKSIKRKKVAELETEYFSNASKGTPTAILNTMPQAKAYLNGLISGDRVFVGHN